MYRDIGYYWLRLAIYVALAIGLATVFYDVGASYESIQVWEREREREREIEYFHNKKCYIHNIFTTNPKWQVVTNCYCWGKNVILVINSNLNQ